MSATQDESATLQAELFEEASVDWETGSVELEKQQIFNLSSIFFFLVT